MRKKIDPATKIGKQGGYPYLITINQKHMTPTNAILFAESQDDALERIKIGLISGDIVGQKEYMTANEPRKKEENQKHLLKEFEKNMITVEPLDQTQLYVGLNGLDYHLS